MAEALLDSRSKIFPNKKVTIDIQTLTFPDNEHHIFTIHVGQERVYDRSVGRDHKKQLFDVYRSILKSFADGKSTDGTIKKRVFNKKVTVTLQRFDDKGVVDGKENVYTNYGVCIYVGDQLVRHMPYCKGREREAMDDYNTIVGAFIMEDLGL